MPLSCATLVSTNSPVLRVDPAAMVVLPTRTTETRCPDWVTNSIVASAPARMSSTARAASAGLRSRGAVGSRVGATARPPPKAAPAAGAPGIVRSLLTAVFPAYTRQATSQNAETGRIVIPPGSDVAMDGSPSPCERLS